MVSGTIRYWAAAKEAAGTAQEDYEADTLAQALEQARAKRHGDDRFARVLAMSSFLVDEEPVGNRTHTEMRLTQGGAVEVLPPFAGG